MRLGECICTTELTWCNTGTPAKREEFAQHVREDCGVRPFRFFGPKGADGANGKKNELEWTNIQMPQLRKILHSFDLSRVYFADGI